MAGVTVRGGVEAKWLDGGLKGAAGSSAELARLAVQVLVEDLGTEGARVLLRDELATYLPDYQGAVIDKRSARKE